MATRKRHSPEQIVRKLMAADRLLAEGKDTAGVCRELGVSEATYHRWRNQFGGSVFLCYLARHIEHDGDRHGPMARSLVRRLCGSDGRLWAEAELEKSALKEIARGNF